MPEEHRLVIGSLAEDHVTIEPVRRSYPDATDHENANWLGAVVALRAGTFRGEVDATLRADDFEQFRESLRKLHDRLEGEATFTTLEHWLAIRVMGDGKGHLVAQCVLRDEAAERNSLKLEIPVARESVPPMIQQLNEIIAQYPVIGRP